MRISNEQKATEAVEEWKSFSPQAQVMRLRKAIEALELDEMYYDQKGSERGMLRCEACLAILNGRLAELRKENVECRTRNLEPQK